MLEVLDLHKSYPGISAVNNVSFHIHPQEVLALVGPSGCGKTTLMRMIAGLEEPDSGGIRWNDTDLAKVPVDQRHFGLMFQDYALFPHMNVSRNIAFGLDIQKISKGEQAARVKELLALVGLQGFEKRSVGQLSGGEQQRVALARSLAPQPRLLMLDEPLGALDRALRERLQIDLKRILKEAKQTTLYVTHDQEEAFSLADRVAVMNAGKIVQLDTPRNIYRCPASSFVAKFIGFDNLYPATPGQSDQGPTAQTAIGEIPLPEPLTKHGILLLRPDRISVGDQGPVTLHCEVISSAFRGSLIHLKVRAGDGEVEIHTTSYHQTFHPGKPIAISFDPTEAVQILPS